MFSFKSKTFKENPRFSIVSFAVFSLVFALIGIYIVFYSSAAVPEPPKAAIALEKSASGEEAIRALGTDLPDVAKAYGKSTDALEKAFRGDKSLHVDTKGKLYYVEEAVAADGSTTTDTSVYASAPLADTFTLHSRAGSNKVIYLDFNGDTITGTAWNGVTTPETITAPAWDLDGSATTFGDVERTRIQQIWKRVVEDYAPFDVDVTTQDPGDAAITKIDASDNTYGIHIVISPVSSYFGNYGGIAYVGSFDTLGSFYRTAIIFPENLAQTEKYIAESCAHESGHTLGLLHQGVTAGVTYYAGQGTGTTAWAPILGNGYYKNLTQWSRGEYTQANNSEDELAIITKYISYRIDDFGNNSSGATLLPASTSLSTAGVIDHTGDIDVVSFRTGAGNITLTANPAPLGPDLDIALELRNSAGTVIASSNPLGALNASISTTVAEGTYYLSISGTGEGNPLVTGYSSYGSLGNWSLTGTVTLPAITDTIPPVVNIVKPTTTANVTGIVDVSTTATDNAAISNVSFYLDSALKLTQTTPGADGNFGLALDTKTVANGSHVIRAVATDTSNLTATSQVAVTVNNDVTAPTVSFVRPTGGSIVSGIVDVSVSAKDNTAVAKVNFYVDDILKLSQTAPGADGNYGFGLESRALTNASHVIKAVVTDAVGLTANTTVSVTVLNATDTAAPSISITSPKNGATIKSSGTTVVFSAIDTSIVSSVILTIDNVQVKSFVIAINGSYGYNWQKITKGTHTITVTATDNSGNQSKASITVKK